MRQQRQKSNTATRQVKGHTIRKIGKGSAGGRWEVRVNGKTITGSLSKCKKAAHSTSS